MCSLHSRAPDSQHIHDPVVVENLQGTTDARTQVRPDAQSRELACSVTQRLLARHRVEDLEVEVPGSKRDGCRKRDSVSVDVGSIQGGLGCAAKMPCRNILTVRRVHCIAQAEESFHMARLGASVSISMA